MVFLLVVVLYSALTTAIVFGQSQNLVGWAARDPLVPKQANFQCSNGPPGFYCTSDLTGYAQCNPDGSRVDVLCPAKTRCSCFVGPKCDATVTNPCQLFTAPPVLPGDITTVSHGTLSVRTPYLAITYQFTKQQFQATSNNQLKRRGDRQDTTWVDGNGSAQSRSIQSTFISQGANGLFNKYVAQLSRRGTTCLSSDNDVEKMPAIQIPPEAHQDGFEMIVGERAHRWVLHSGGMNRGSAWSTEYFYYVEDAVRNLLRPVRYHAKFNFGPTAKTSLTVNETFGLFYAQLVPSVAFYATKPAAC